MKATQHPFWRMFFYKKFPFFRVGRIFLELRLIGQKGITGFLREKYVQLALLPKIVKYPAIKFYENETEIHMLLSEEHLFQGMWALYSFLYFSNERFSGFIYDDGTLSKEAQGLLKDIFPGIRVIQYDFLCETIEESLRDKKLLYALEAFKTRSRYRCMVRPFAIAHFCKSKRFLNLDSDVLFFEKPTQLLEGLKGTNEERVIYLQDTRTSYCQPPEILEHLVKGNELINNYSAGLFSANKDVCSLREIERLLSHQNLFVELRSKKMRAHTEQTLWALLASIHGKSKALGATYTHIYAKNQNQNTAIHYCGNVFLKSMFYTKGIPQLEKVIKD